MIISEGTCLVPAHVIDSHKERRKNGLNNYIPQSNSGWFKEDWDSIIASSVYTQVVRYHRLHYNTHMKGRMKLDYDLRKACIHVNLLALEANFQTMD